MHFFKAGNQYPGVTPSAVLTLRVFQELNFKKKEKKKEYTSLKPCESGASTLAPYFILSVSFSQESLLRYCNA